MHTTRVHAEHRKFLRYVFNGKTFEFQCLPFGLKSAPQAFVKLMTQVIAHIRTFGICIVVYLDYILVLHQDPDVLREIFGTIVTLLEGLGLIINQDKCSLCLLQQLLFLGAMLNSTKMSLSLPLEKLNLIQQCSLRLQSNHR